MATGHRLFAAAYDRLSAAAERTWLGPRRVALLAEARGVVLEIGAGTGANLGHYGGGVERLVVTEPDPFMRARLERKAVHALVPVEVEVEVVEAAAERLPFADGTFDTVVATLVLCTVVEPAAALAEARRLLRPGGRLLFLEHVRGDGTAARWQDCLEPLWRRLGAGCHPNRDTVTAIQQAGFAIDRLDRFEPPVPFAALLPFVTGVASA
jgi:SAM-dependent methyltransferase